MKAFFHSSRKKGKKLKSSSPSKDIDNDDTKTGSTNSKASKHERIKHLTEFLDDRKELHTQLFTIIPKKEVKEMMPDILKVLKTIGITSKINIIPV